MGGQVEDPILTMKSSAELMASLERHASNLQLHLNKAVIEVSQAAVILQTLREQHNKDCKETMDKIVELQRKWHENS